jgi:hypothetical protein
VENQPGKSAHLSHHDDLTGACSRSSKSRVSPTERWIPWISFSPVVESRGSTTKSLADGRESSVGHSRLLPLARTSRTFSPMFLTRTSLTGFERTPCGDHITLRHANECASLPVIVHGWTGLHVLITAVAIAVFGGQSFAQDVIIADLRAQIHRLEAQLGSQCIACTNVAANMLGRADLPDEVSVAPTGQHTAPARRNDYLSYAVECWAPRSAFSNPRCNCLGEMAHPKLNSRRTINIVVGSWYVPAASATLPSRIVGYNRLGPLAGA